MLRAASALSIVVIVGCAVWWRRLTGPNSPLIDYRPLFPILLAVVLLAVIWCVFAVITYRRGGR
jgi:hypothetical protein